MKPVKTWAGQIYVGLRVGYTDEVLPISVVKDVCRYFVNAHKLCVTVTATEFFYVDGEELGAIVGMIQYPRFPMSASDLEDRLFALAALLKTECGQQRVSLVMPDKTVTLGGRK